MRRTCAILATLALLAALAAPVAADVFLSNLEPEIGINGLSGYSVYGNQMAGMTVQAKFYDGSGIYRVDNLVWQNLGGTLGGVIGVDWSLKVDGDTFADNAWNFVNDTGWALVRLDINPLPGGVVFDTIFDPSHLPDDLHHEGFTPANTPGSERGKARYWPHFIDAGGNTILIFAMYSGMVKINDDPDSPYGDLFGAFALEIGAPPAFSDRLTWSADTDFIYTPSYPIPPYPFPDLDMIKRGGETVPLPGSVVLLGSGLLGMAGWRRFRKS